MLIERTILNQIKSVLKAKRRVVIIYGPRQAGKTTLLGQILAHLPNNEVISFVGDDLRVQEIFSRPRLDLLKEFIGHKRYLVIDEAQRIENISLTLKLIYDQLPVRVIITGSASLDLAGKINEPLTGRTHTYFLYPLSWSEMPFSVLIEPKEKIEQIMRFGSYPKAVTLTGEKEKGDYLSELINNYLYRDILSLGQIRKPKKVVDLLTLLALQIGAEVSIQELAQNLSLAKPVVERYLDILEKMFVIFNLRGFSRNLRKEISKTSKYYFWDLGLRNALLRNFNPLKLRDDIGSLFENFGISERIKSLRNQGILANYYFWRTYDQKEIDLIEERGGKLQAFEFKWQTTKAQLPKEFLQTYTNSDFRLVTVQNWPDIIPMA